MSPYILPLILTLCLLWALLFFVWVFYRVTHNGESLFDSSKFWEDLLVGLLAATSIVFLFTFGNIIWWLLKLIWAPYL